MPLIQPPHVTSTTQGAAASNGLLISPQFSVWILASDSAPTGSEGQGWVGTGSLVVDTSTGFWYRNAGTRDAPSWVRHGG